MSNDKITLQLIGGNRGGRAFEEQVDKEGVDLSRVRNVEVIDLHEERAEALAETFRDREIPATGVQGTVDLSFKPPEIRITAIDDATDAHRILRGSKDVPLRATGLVVSSDRHGPLGGDVFSLEAVITPGNFQTQEDAEALGERMEWLSPTRETSKNVTTPVLNGTAAKIARTSMHAHFAREVGNLIEGQPVQSAVSLFDSQRGERHHVNLVEVPRHERKHQLKRAATHEILPSLSETGNLAGVAFYSKEDPWIYFVLAKFLRGRWVFRRAIELPVRPPHVVQIPSQDSRVGRLTPRTQRSDDFSRIFVTD